MLRNFFGYAKNTDFDGLGRQHLEVEEHLFRNWLNIRPRAFLKSEKYLQEE